MIFTEDLIDGKGHFSLITWVLYPQLGFEFHFLASALALDCSIAQRSEPFCSMRPDNDPQYKFLRWQNLMPLNSKPMWSKRKIDGFIL